MVGYSPANLCQLKDNVKIELSLNENAFIIQTNVNK